MKTILISFLLLTSSLIAQNVLMQKYFSPKDSPSLSGLQIEQQQRKVAGEKIKLHQQRIRQLRTRNTNQAELSALLKPQNIMAGTGSISGIVREEGGAKTRNSFDVHVYDEYGKYCGGDYIDYTSGAYLIPNLNAGKYYVVTGSSSYYINEYYNNTTNWENAELVEVGTVNVPDINFYLAHFNGFLSGRVLTEQSEPISDCNILMISAGPGYEYFYFAFSDSGGYYIVENVPGGAYKIEANGGSNNYCTEWYNNAEDESDAQIILVNENDTTKNIDFVLKRGGAISGKVRGMTDEGYPLSIFIHRSVNEIVKAVSPDSLGNYLCTGLNAGSYFVEFDYYGIENLLSGYYPDAVYVQDAVPVKVALKDTIENIDFTFQKGGVITGKITTASAEPVYIGFQLWDEQNRSLYAAYNMQDNAYSIFRIPPGKYRLSTNTDQYITQWYNKKSSLEQAEWISVNSVDTVKDINFELNEGGSIEGMVYNPSGQILLESFGIEVYDENNHNVKSIYGSAGMFSIKGLNPGSYKLYLYYSGKYNYANQWYNKKSNQADADNVIVNDKLVTQVNFFLDYSAEMHGFVYQEPGKRVQGNAHEIVRMLFDSNTGILLNMGSVSFNGGYSITAPFGSYKIGFMSYDNMDSLAVTYFGGGNSINDPESKIVNINSLDILKLEDVMMEKVSGSLSGAFLHYADSSVFNKIYFSVVVLDESGYLAKIYYADFLQSAEFKINGLRPGNYYVLGFIDNYGEYERALKWYGNISANPDSINFPVFNIPAGAVPVAVNDGDTPGINFYFDISTGISTNQQIVNEFRLEQNYPNPFNPATSIRYRIPELSNVTLKIYSVLGEEVNTLINEEQKAGEYTVSWNAVNIPSGVYIYQLKSDTQISTKKLLLLR